MKDKIYLGLEFYLYTDEEGSNPYGFDYTAGEVTR